MVDVYKVVVIGDPKVGKSSLISAFMNVDTGDKYLQSRPLHNLGQGTTGS
jgi:GTPase SAR1 family protein